MANLTRVTGKVFAGEASSDQVGQFGSAAAGDPTNTTDVATIQSRTAYEQGWGEAVIPTRNFPPLEEVNGVLKTISYQTCYLLQEGVPTYDSGTNYSVTSIVKTISGDDVLFYRSLKNDNIGNALSDTTSWEKVYFENEYEPNITANRSIALTGAVTGSVSYQLTDTNKYNLSISTTGVTKTVKLTGDVTGSATMSTSNINTVSISTTLANSNKIDGQWTYKKQLITSSATATQTPYEFDLSSYLGVSSSSTTQYEILFTHSYYADTQNTRKGIIYSDVISNYFEGSGNDGYGCMSATNYGRTTAYMGTIPVKTKIYMDLKGNFTTNVLIAIGYRRLGTNQ